MFLTLGWGRRVCQEGGGLAPPFSAPLIRDQTSQTTGVLEIGVLQTPWRPVERGRRADCVRRSHHFRKLEKVGGLAQVELNPCYKLVHNEF